jgi:tetratricopeptide (TPR) repeat protein
VIKPAAQVFASPFQNQSRVEQGTALASEGLAALERDDRVAAKALFTRAIEADPNNVTAHSYLGMLADQAGNLAEAERHFAAAAIADPLSPAARNNHGAILLRLGRVEQAATQFETSLRLDKGNVGALVNLAQIRFAKGTPQDMQRARELFERARSIAPDAEIARSLVIIALRLNDRAAAAAYFKDYSERILASNGAITTASSRAEMGAALLAAGLIDEAIQELNATVTAEPANVSAIILLAQAYLARKDIPAAGRTLESAVARGIEAAPVYAALAEVYQNSGHIENAIPAMRLAIERDSGNESYRFRYAMLLVDTSAPAAAIIRLQEALAQFPRSAKLWFALGVAHFKNRKHEDAATAFQHAIEFDSKFAPALAYLGMTYDEMGQYTEAIAFYERAVKADDNLAAAHYLAGDGLLRQTSPDFARAEAHLSRAVALDPGFPPARLTLAKLYSRLDRPAEAATQLEHLVAAYPNLAEAQYQLGRVYMRLKRTEEAQKALAAFKRLSDNQQQQSQNDRQELIRRLANVRF